MKPEPQYAIVDHRDYLELPDGREYGFIATCEVCLKDGRKYMEVVDVIAWNDQTEPFGKQGNLTLDEMVEVEREAKGKCYQERDDIIEKSML